MGWRVMIGVDGYGMVVIGVMVVIRVDSVMIVC